MVERKRAELERLTLALSVTTDTLWDWDIVADRVVFNERWWQMLGYAEDEVEPSTAAWARLVHPDDAPAALNAIVAHLRGTTPMFETEERIRAKSGEWRWMRTRGKVVARNAAGRALRATGTHTDITEQKQLEERLRQAQKMEAVGQLAAGVAHDFNNILTAITMYAQLLRQELGGNDPRCADVDEILAGAGRASALIAQLLAFARRQMLRPELLDLNAIVAGMEPLFQRLLPAAIQLELLTDRAPTPIQADRTQIEQVLINLVINARDAIRDGGTITIETRVRPDAEEGPATLLIVSDTGVGMDADTRARAFEPFFTTKPLGQGTGLGLSTVYGIVEQSGGTVTLESEPQRGTRVTVAFPLRSGAGGGEQAAGPGVAGTPATQVPGAEHVAGATEAGVTVLLVEDEDPVRRSAQRILERAGYRVIAARHGGDAVQRLDAMRGSIDVLLTDVEMPVMNGVELAKRAATLVPGIRIVLMSGYSDLLIPNPSAAPAFVLLRKPFTAASLVAALRQHAPSEP